jgi:seryl-tRNA synthetase
MLQVPFIRSNIELVKERLTFRNFSKVSLIDELVSLDDKRKAMQFAKDELLGKVNAISKEIGALMKAGDRTAAEERKKEVAEIRVQLEDKAGIDELENSIRDILYQIPNLPSMLVPAGISPQDNVTVRENGSAPTLHAGAVPHWDLAKRYDLIDFELGNKITGSGFPVYKKQGAKFQRALIQYFLDFNLDAGYEEILPPHMVNEASAFGTGQLPDKEGQMYHATADNLFLIPTAEVPVTNLYRDEILKDTDLPVKMTAYTPCFRREAGSYGKDVRGLNRVHQFDKVEVVQLVHPDKSYEVIEEMTAHVEKLLQSLELPYRVLRLCGGDMGFTSALTYDLEVFSAAQEKWLEVSSVSNFETYQSNRMKIRFKEGGGKTQLVHTLNGSSLALPRIYASLLENNQQEDHISVPQVLQKYFGSDRITK